MVGFPGCLRAKSGTFGIGEPEFRGSKNHLPYNIQSSGVDNAKYPTDNKTSYGD